MKKSGKPLVIAIGGVSGGGKTTIVTQLKQQFGKAEALYFDSYDFEGPENVFQWIEDGANYDEWNLTPLIRDLKEVLLKRHDYIFLDFPFAYQHSQTSGIIDLVVFIDTPLDIALIRRMNREFRDSSAEEMLQYMESYATYGRRGYLEMLQTIRPDSNVVIDGTLSISQIVEKIREQVNRL
ncbi:hypothetical protein [Planomicrobium sp. CPCC 101110]|uniref:hypothetical protein n=1 Tax=Planomicrobium sp. CPCC 101110 TaxID=2599619 RepID=UPI0011B54CAC|nr:hypothetical protein [Planomicrobium sp. CPCC 101110]TWT24351.1 hypothetical protein FQV30_16450 [Planomicrobium sp. CPCC 101110]